MIFTFTNSDFGFDKIFHNRNLDALDWESRIPSPDLEIAQVFDPDLLQDLYSAGKNGISYIANLYLYNTITSVRIAIGKMAKMVGFLQTQFHNISNIFKEAADAISMVFDYANSFINSEFFQKGLDALGAIPVVGWIIKIIAKIAEMVYKLVDFIIRNKIKDAKAELTSQPWIPITEFKKGADEELARSIMMKIEDGNLEYLFLPRNYYEKFEDFYVRREKRTGSDNQPLERTDFFNITSSNNTINGIGFIPGTNTIDGPLRFPTHACAGVLNAGELYPTAINICESVYQSVQNNGPGLFGIRPDYVSSAWKTTIYNLLDYAEKSIKLGWTCSPTGEFNSKKFTCNPDTLGTGNKDCSKKYQIGNKVSLPSNFTGHYTGLREHIIKTYFGDTFPLLSGKTKYTPENIDIDKSIPSRALKVLRERQKAAIDSINCMYVNDLMHKGLPRFPAIYEKDGVLNKKWNQNVTAVLQSKEEWKKVYFLDVPDGPVKNELYQLAKKNNINPEKEGPIQSLISNKLAIPSILPDPKLPEPFAPIDLSLKPKRAIKNGNSSSNSILPLVLGLGGAAILLKK